MTQAYYKWKRQSSTSGRMLYGFGGISSGKGVYRKSVSRLTLEALKDIMKKSREGVVRYW